MWRKIKKDDIKRGTVIRITGMSDTAYNGATIIAVSDNYTHNGARTSPHEDVRIARPMAYAHDHFDSRSPMLSCEVFEMTVERMCKENTDIEVWECGNGAVDTMTT